MLATESVDTEDRLPLAYRMTVEFKVEDVTRAAVLQGLRGIAEATRVRAGCRRFEVYQATDDPNALMLVEEWESQEAMNTHIRSRDFRVVLSVIDMSSETPRVQFDMIAATEGLAMLTDFLLSAD